MNFRLLVLLALLATPSCASKKETPQTPFVSATATPPKPSFLQSCVGKITSIFPKKKSPPAARPPLWAGVIRMVNQPENFVLVESAAISAAVPGETYLAVGKGVETATLRMTSLKNPPFLIADIVSGSPSPGDRIYLPGPASAAQPAKPKPSPKNKPAQPGH